MSVDDQLALLKSRGLSISDDLAAKKFLLENNYFRISGFTLNHRKNDCFFKGKHIDEIMQIYSFDLELRTIVLGVLERIEITYKSLIAYYHGKAYGPLGYENSSNFTDINAYSHILSKILNLKKHYSDNQEIFLKHYVEDLAGQLPIWAAVELLNFTDISKLFSALPKVIKIEIAHDYLHMSFGSAPEYMCNWLRCSSVLRNITAHRGRLYNRSFSIKPKLSTSDKQRLLKDSHNNPIIGTLFSYILAAKNLLPNETVWKDFAYDIEELTYRFPAVKLKDYGFPENWKNSLSGK